MSAGAVHIVALKSDGTVVCWGLYVGDELPHYIPVPEEAHGAVAIEARVGYYMALKPDGTLVTWGDLVGFWGPPPITNGIRAVSGWDRYFLGLRDDGTVFSWRPFGYSEPVPPGLSNVIAITVGGSFSAALKSDGTVVAWGDPIGEPPPELTDLLDAGREGLERAHRSSSRRSGHVR